MRLPISIRARCKWFRRQPFERWAGLITSCYLSLFLAVLLARAGEFFALPLNELGDFAAGIFAPLAFLWLVLGYRQQGKELSTSARALEAQVAELKANFALQQENSDKQDRMLDPVLDLKSEGVSIVNQYRLERLLVENSSNLCKQLRITFESADGQGKTHPGAILAQLTEGKSVRFDGPPSTEFASWRIIMDYVRANGSRGQQTFIFMRFPGRSPLITLELEPPI